MKIHWVNHKTVDMNTVGHCVEECIKTKCMTNNGKYVQALQLEIPNMFNLSPNKSVLMVCNGSAGINALIAGFNIHFKKQLKWAVQAFTFPCSCQGLLQDSIVIDIDDNMGPNLQSLEALKESYDGILVTNCFGTCANIDAYETFAKAHGKLLVFDNAAAPMTFYNGRNIQDYGAGCMVSLHHTKPIGFGEGGFIVFDNVYIDSMRKAICFGYTDTDKYTYDSYAGNYKMSEIAAIYSGLYLKNLQSIYVHHTEMTKYFIKKLVEANIYGESVFLLPSFTEYSMSLMSTLPVVLKCNNFVTTTPFIEHGIEAKKYYYPLCQNCKVSQDIFNHIICLPLNMDTTKDHIDIYVDVLKGLYESKET
jgi:dTDP-4-amino-4,6-dideoxygalactose transaminase